MQRAVSEPLPQRSRRSDDRAVDPAAPAPGQDTGQAAGRAAGPVVARSSGAPARQGADRGSMSSSDVRATTNRARGVLRVVLAVAALASLAPVFVPAAAAIAANVAADAAPMPVVDLDAVRQTRWNTCGPAAVATLASWLGRPTSEADVLGIARLGDDGISLAEFTRLADLRGVPGSWYRAEPASLGSVPTPFVAHLTAPDDHFVVVRAVVRSYVVMADPAVGAVVVPLRALVRRFGGRVFVPREAT